MKANQMTLNISHLLIILSIILTGCKPRHDAPLETSTTSRTKQTSTSTSTIPTSSYQIDNSYGSPNQDARQMMLVMHYTALPLDETLQRFSDANYAVSAHYVVPEISTDNPFKIFQIVPEDKRAWHAGVSYWQGNTNINPSSIGIETINLGFPVEDENLPVMQRRWYPYHSSQQIAALGQLAKDIIARYQITPTRVIGHADIAPGRKFDPGPLFPWKQLYDDYGVGAWYDDDTVNFYRAYAPWNGDIQLLQSKLKRYGYNTPEHGLYDQATHDAISAFQMHFYHSKYDGDADIETVARLDALLEKYKGQQRPSL